MTVRRGLTLAAVVALVAAAAAVLLTLGRASLYTDGTATPVAAAPAITDTTWPSYVVPSSSSFSSSGAPSASSSSPATVAATPASSPAPFVQRFADGPTASPQPKQKSPTAAVKVTAFVDGCNHHYGTTTQCVPLAFPDGVTGVAGKCAWLAAHGFVNLKVAGEDDQGLDPDGNGIACD